MSGQDWKRLGHEVAGKRYKMGYEHARAFANAVGLNERTIGRLENGHSVGRNTLIAVEHFFGWPTGASDEILAGGEPPEAVEAASKKSKNPEEFRPRDVVEEKIWAIKEIPERHRKTYIHLWRAEQQQGQTG